MRPHARRRCAQGFAGPLARPRPRDRAHLRREDRSQQPEHVVHRDGVRRLWKTTNRGASFTPLFDDQGAHNLCCIDIDPKNSNALWLGTGENHSQRSAHFGDGVYKSLDAGNTWKRVGLAQSEHIGKMLIDPRNSDVVYVALAGSVVGSAANVASQDHRRRCYVDAQPVHQRQHGNHRHRSSTRRTPMSFTRRHIRVVARSDRLLERSPEGGLHKSTDAWQDLDGARRTGFPRETWVVPPSPSISRECRPHADHRVLRGERGSVGTVQVPTDDGATFTRSGVNAQAAGGRGGRAEAAGAGGAAAGPPVTAADSAPALAAAPRKLVR